MHFPKDILIIDFEGLQEPVQVGAVLLDKDTLEEKKQFVSYIWADLQGAVKQYTGISQATLEGAPTQAEVGRQLRIEFGVDVTIATWVAVNDMRHFAGLMEAACMNMKEYDYHVIDLWTAGYLHLLARGYKGGMRSEEMFRAFGAAPRGLHDALEDCRIAAEVLRTVIGKS